MSLLITIEGIDGSGKTTLLKNLKQKGGLNLVTHNWRDTALVAFEELARKVINPNLREDKRVVIDRYLDSTLVYQGLEGNISLQDIQEIAYQNINLPPADLTFILDFDPQQAQERLRKRKLETGEYTNWDNLKLEFHRRIRDNYLRLKKLFPERIWVIDASQSEEKILTEVLSVINSFPASTEKILPSGRIEAGETPEMAAKREV
ncbi:21699_t:CDS:2 [Gigaspora margarita]|uniref:dTMP kinase n=1 Tax=Gigaspora margarita TaxID=4874 RepID=A0ABM8VV65_GIGMA|nr:21699_t:CDS:2 [Gigaspora margarita]